LTRAKATALFNLKRHAAGVVIADLVLFQFSFQIPFADPARDQECRREDEKPRDRKDELFSGQEVEYRLNVHTYHLIVVIVP
jgi:hypothetical protein